MAGRDIKIVLSYRRDDAPGTAGRIFDRLAQHFGRENVFMDIDSIPIGVDFVDHIQDVLDGCNALVAVIGPRWTGPRRGKPPRIKDETDFVRLEVEAALQREISVAPVLVDGAVIPRRDQLPAPLHALIRRNAAEVDSGRDFHAHVDRLIRDLDRLLPATAASAALSQDLADRQPGTGFGKNSDGPTSLGARDDHAVPPDAPLQPVDVIDAVAANTATMEGAVWQLDPWSKPLEAVQAYSPAEEGIAPDSSVAEDDLPDGKPLSSFSGTSVLPRIRWGTRYLDGGDADRAIACFSEAIALDPKCGAFHGRGLAYRMKGESERAIADFTEAISIDPKHLAAYCDRAAAFEKSGESDNALRDYETALQISPQHGDALAGRARLRSLPGEKDGERSVEPIPPKRWSRYHTAIACLLALAVATALALGALVSWNHLWGIEDARSPATSDPVAEAKPSPPKQAVAVPPVLRVSKDPIVVNFTRAPMQRLKTREIPRPEKLNFPGISDSITVLSDIMLSSDRRFMTKLPSTPKDFASFEARPARPLTSGIIQDVAAPLPESKSGVDTVTAVGELPEANPGAGTFGSSVVVLPLDLDRFQQSKDFFVNVKASRSLDGLAIERGFASTDAKLANDALKDVLDIETLSAGMIVGLRGYRASAEVANFQLVQVSVYANQTYLGSVARADDGTFVAGTDPWVNEDSFGEESPDEAAEPPIRHRLLDAIYSTAARNNVPTGVIGEALMLLARSEDLSASATSDDRLLLAFSHEARDDGAGRVLYASVVSSRKKLVCYVFQAKAGADFSCMDENAQAQADTAVADGMVTPVNGVLTSTFGPRMRPILKVVRIHNGVDWVAPVGTPVFAAFDGTVSFAADGQDFGNVVRLAHKDGRETRYAHLSRFAWNIKVGTVVKAGDIIGYVGTSGLATGPHLHFELYKDGQAIDPLKIGTNDTAASDVSAIDKVVDQIVRVDSGGNANAKNPLTSATGIGQFIESTWIRVMKKYRPDLAKSLSREDLLTLRFDPTISREMVRLEAKENEAFLRENNQEITAGRIYLSHFLGQAGAVTLLTASADLDLADVLGQSVIDANPFLQGKTVGYVIDWAERKMTGRSSTVAASPLSADFQRYQQSIDELMDGT